MMQVALNRLKQSSIKGIIYWLFGQIWKNAEYFFVAAIVAKCFIFNIFVGSKTTIMFLVGAAGTAVVMMSLVFWLSRRPRAVALFVLDILVSVLMVSDIVYFRYYDNLITYPVLKQIGQVDSALTSSIINLLSPWDLVFFADAPFFIIIIALVFRDEQKSMVRFWQRVRNSFAVLMTGLCMVFVGLFVVAVTMGKTAFTSVFDNGYFLRNVGVIGYHAFDAYYNMTKVVNEQEPTPVDIREEIKSMFESRKPVSNPKLKGKARGKNLIVIQVEALQNFVLGLEVNGMEVTPNLNRLARENIYFSSYYSQIAQGNTSDAEFVTNNSFYPLSQGAAYFRCVNNTFASLPALFREQGYATVAMHAYKGSYWNRAVIYPRLGFDVFYSQKDFEQDELIGWGLSDRSFFTQAVGRIKEMPKPFYAFMVTLTSHYPFNGFKKDDVFGMDLSSFNTYRNYLNAMHYVDQCIGEFLQQLDEAGLLKDTVIAIYGDHEGLKKKDENEIDPEVNPAAKNGLGWYNMKNVPLIIMVPGLKGPLKIDTVGGQVDFLPTIANLFGLQPVYYMGRDLINSRENYVIFRDGTVTDGKTVYFAESDECIDIASGEPVDRENFAGYIERCLNDLRISDEVLENNMLADFLGVNENNAWEAAGQEE